MKRTPFLFIIMILAFLSSCGKTKVPSNVVEFLELGEKYLILNFALKEKLFLVKLPLKKPKIYI